MDYKGWSGLREVWNRRPYDLLLYTKTHRYKNAIRETAQTIGRRRKIAKYIDKSPIGARHTKAIYNALSRNGASIFCQLRTGKSRLNDYLFKIKAAESDLCECGERETVRHFLFFCNRWSKQRRQIQQHRRFGDLPPFLGAYSNRKDIKGRPIDGPYERWRPDMELVRMTIEFARATERLAHQKHN